MNLRIHFLYLAYVLTLTQPLCNASMLPVGHGLQQLPTDIAADDAEQTLKKLAAVDERFAATEKNRILEQLTATNKQTKMQSLPSSKNSSLKVLGIGSAITIAGYVWYLGNSLAENMICQNSIEPCAINETYKNSAQVLLEIGIITTAIGSFLFLKNPYNTSQRLNDTQEQINVLPDQQEQALDKLLDEQIFNKEL